MRETFYEAGKRALEDAKRIRRERAMTKPDDIPQDVWESSQLLNKIANEIFTGSIDEAAAFVDRHVEAIARAIMAERDRFEIECVNRVMHAEAKAILRERRAIRNRGVN